MEFLTDIQQHHNNPEGLEALYQQACQQRTEEAFKAAIDTCHADFPDNLLYAAWYYRLAQAVSETEKSEKGANWLLAIPLAILTGLLIWVLSGDSFVFLDQIPLILLFFTPIAAISVMIYLALSGKKEKLPVLWMSLGVLVFPVYAWLILPTQRGAVQVSYGSMALLHIALLVWIGIGWSVVGRKSSADSQFAFIIKSFEVLVSAGLFAIAGGIFGGITIGMFTALGVDVPEWIMRLIFAGGAGVIPVIAVASVYNPLLEPLAQSFGQGVSRLMPILIRLLLPSTLLVLLIYIVLIPFNFRAPIENRDVLIVNNGMLFAILGLLLGATPVKELDLPAILRPWMRRGINAVAALAILISLYALTAILVRTFADSLTLNRVVVIGWNLANIGILITLLFRQFKYGTEKWVESLHKTFSNAIVVYLGWALFVILITPLIFR